MRSPLAQEELFGHFLELTGVLGEVLDQHAAIDIWLYDTYVKGISDGPSFRFADDPTPIAQLGITGEMAILGQLRISKTEASE